MPEPIFSISGLRGVVGKNLFPQTVEEIAGCYGRLLGPGRFVIGRDSRPSSAELAAAARTGLLKTGCTVIDLGVCPTPTVVHSVRSEKDVKGGLVITASHNPINWNGMKFVHPEGRFILPDEFARLKAALAERAGVSADQKLSTQDPGVERKDGIKGHIRAIREHRFFKNVDVKGLRIGVDAVNGAASLAAKELLQAFGCEAVGLFCSPGAAVQEFPRPPEPTPENLLELCELVKGEGLDGGFAFDPDGDRFSCVDEQGVPLGEEASLCLAALYLLPEVKGPVVINLSTSRAVEDIALRFGVKVFRTKVGEAQVVQKVKEIGAVLGGEGNGGVIFPEINLTRDGLVAAATVLGLLTKTKKKLSAIRSELPQYFIVKEKLPKAGYDQIGLVERLRIGLDENLEFDFTEGIRVVGADWWVHIRASNTEPNIRIVAEARTMSRAKEIVAQVKRNWR
jgi:phosphomannomutase